MVKFDLHNRVRLGYWDAKIHLWFRRRSTLKFALDYFAIYTCLVGMSLIHFHLMQPVFSDRRWLTDHLPSRAYQDLETPISLWLNGLLTPECDETGDEQCTLMQELNRQDEQYLATRIAVSSYNQLLGSDGAPVTTPLLFQLSHLAVALAGAWALKKLGFQWN